MMELQRVIFSRVKNAYQSRWQRARPGNAFVNPHDTIPGRFLVRIQGGSDHEVVLVRSHGEFWADCDCEHIQFEGDGACAHMTAVFRLHADERDHWHEAKPESIKVELDTPDNQKVDHWKAKEQAMADGGEQ